MTSRYPSVLACADERDAFHCAWVQKRCTALRTLLPALARRLPAEARALLDSSLRDFERLSPDAQHDAVAAPLFGYWWHQLSLGYQRGDVADLTSWVEHLPRLIDMSFADNRLPRLRERIIVGSADPWIREYISTANENTRADGNHGDVAVAPPEEAVDGIAAALAVIDRAWPEMGREITLLVRQIVPFHSSEMVAFSNSVLNGLIFLRTDLDDVAIAAERIIHETSHLRMNAVFQLHKVHDHLPEERLPSPYRKVPRPIDGLYHGAFVFARIARFLLHAHKAFAGDDWLRRLREVVQMQEEALELIGRSVRLTPIGRAQFEEFSAATREIRREAFGSAIR